MPIQDPNPTRARASYRQKLLKSRVSCGACVCPPHARKGQGGVTSRSPFRSLISPFTRPLGVCQLLFLQTEAIADPSELPCEALTVCDYTWIESGDSDAI